ncbi:MAG: MarR family transcriptional regulator [Clostridiales bacterium]|nr:MarR family transcriptional regulator [Clostridiales bacterium]
MNRTTMEEYVFGSILLLANKFQIWGDKVLEELTLKQWFLLMLISKMSIQNSSIKEIANFTGTSRQNVKKMIEHLEDKKYVNVIKSETDARALNISLTKKTYDYFNAYEDKGAEAVNTLFSDITNDELTYTGRTLEKLLIYLGNPPLEEAGNGQK